jgi:hypothetical protein
MLPELRSFQASVQEENGRIRFRAAVRDGVSLKAGRSTHRILKEIVTTDMRKKNDVIISS